MMAVTIVGFFQPSEEIAPGSLPTWQTATRAGLFRIASALSGGLSSKERRSVAELRDRAAFLTLRAGPSSLIA
jgi:hypothetical protein